MTVIIDGKQLAAELLFKLRNTIVRLDYQPRLVVLLVGDDPASTIYVRRKSDAALSVGIDATTIHLPADILQDELIDSIDLLNDAGTVDGILVQLPLPSHIDTAAVLEAIDPLKDVDGFHP